MARADYEGIVRYSAVDNDIGEAVDAQFKRVLINNALHYADEDGQVLAFYPGHTYGTFTTSYSGTSPIKVTDFGPLRLRIKSGRESYKVRFRVYGNTTGAGTCKVWVILGDIRYGAAYAAFGGTNVAYVSPTGSAGWLTSYAADGTGLTTLVLPLQENSASTHDTLDGIGGSSTAVKYVTASLSLWVQGISGTGSFQLGQFYAAEVYGA